MSDRGDFSLVKYAVGLAMPTLLATGWRLD
jgi:hypothetical protein